MTIGLHFSSSITPVMHEILKLNLTAIQYTVLGMCRASVLQCLGRLSLLPCMGWSLKYVQL